METPLQGSRRVPLSGLELLHSPALALDDLIHKECVELEFSEIRMQTSIPLCEVVLGKLRGGRYLLEIHGPHDHPLRSPRSTVMPHAEGAALGSFVQAKSVARLR